LFELANFAELWFLVITLAYVTFYVTVLVEMPVYYYIIILRDEEAAINSAYCRA